MRLPGLPKKILGSEGPTPYGAVTPQMPYFRHLGGPGTDRGRGPQTPNFFGEVQEVPIGPLEKFKWLVQLLHGFFEPHFD